MTVNLRDHIVQVADRLWRARQLEGGAWHLVLFGAIQRAILFAGWPVGRKPEPWHAIKHLPLEVRDFIELRFGPTSRPSL